MNFSFTHVFQKQKWVQHSNILSCHPVCSILSSLSIHSDSRCFGFPWCQTFWWTIWMFCITQQHLLFWLLSLSFLHCGDVFFALCRFQKETHRFHFLGNSGCSYLQADSCEMYRWNHEESRRNIENNATISLVKTNKQPCRAPCTQNPSWWYQTLDCTSVTPVVSALTQTTGWVQS